MSTGDVMAEEVGNFPLDQGNTNALRGMEQAREEGRRSRRLDNEEDNLGDPRPTQQSAAEEERDVARSERIEDRVELTREAREQIEAGERTRAKDRAHAHSTELGEQNSLKDEARNFEENIQRTRTEPNPTDGNKAQTPGQGGSDPEEALNEGFQLGNVQANSAEETASTTEDVEKDQATQKQERNTSESSEVADAPEKQNTELHQRINEDNAEFKGNKEVEIQENNLAETGANIPEARAEEKAEDARQAARNEPPLDIPSMDLEPLEELRDPLEETQDTNRLEAPRPSEIRDEPDATAIETERGQNVSNLI